jgi:hypothetical protein
MDIDFLNLCREQWISNELNKEENLIASWNIMLIFQDNTIMKLKFNHCLLIIKKKLMFY